MTIDTIRKLRRPFASFVCVLTLCGAIFWGICTGNHAPDTHLMILASVVGVDTITRTVDKTKGNAE